MTLSRKYFANRDRVIKICIDRIREDFKDSVESVSAISNVRKIITREDMKMDMNVNK